MAAEKNDKHDKDEPKRDEPKREAKRGKTKTERSEYPKPLVRLKRAPGGFECETRMAASADAETAAKGEGFQLLEVPETDPGFVEYPKWVYHEDGRRGVVWTASEAEALGEGFTDSPSGPDDEATPYGAPPEVTTFARSAPNQPPVPPDRGPDRG